MVCRGLLLATCVLLLGGMMPTAPGQQPGIALELVERTYPVADLLLGGDAWSKGASLRKLVLMSVAPEAWQCRGLPGALTFKPEAGVLVVMQTAEEHEKIAAFLKALREWQGTLLPKEVPADPKVRTIYLAPFENRTVFQGVEDELTAALRKQLRDRTTYLLTATKGRADIEISGTINKLIWNTVLVSPSTGQRVEEYTWEVGLFATNLQRMKRTSAEWPELVPTPLSVTVVTAPELGQAAAAVRASVIEKLASEILKRIDAAR
jgi:hypothetical protein